MTDRNHPNDAPTTRSLKTDGISRRKFLLSAAGMAAASSSIAAYGYYDRHQLEITRTQIPIPGLPLPLVGLKIVQLTDWHYQPNEYYEQVVDLSNDEAPDLVAMTGDFIEDRRLAEEAAVRMSGLKSRLGLFAVTGNHDYWCEAAQTGLFKTMENKGIWLMKDETAKLTHNGTGFTVGGADYRGAGFGKDNFTLCQKEADESLHIQLNHLPLGFDRATNRAQLTLAGHTHGGQILLPLIGNPIMPYGSGAYVSGLYTKTDGRALYVSRGLGTYLLPIRWRCKPEISVLTLVEG